MSPEDKEAIRLLWTGTGMSGSQIAARFGVTRNQVGPMAWRGRWPKFIGPIQKKRRGASYRPLRTMDQRLDAVWAAMRKVHDETEAVLVADRAKWRERERARLIAKRLQA